MPAPLPADWTAIAALAASGVTLEDLSTRFRIKLSTVKARCRRGKWKSAGKTVEHERVDRAVQARQMAPHAGSGVAVVKGALADLGKETRLNLAKATAKAAKHAAGLPGVDALKQARNIKEVVGSGATLHGWAQNHEGGSMPIINIALIGRVLEELPDEGPVYDVPAQG